MVNDQYSFFTGNSILSVVLPHVILKTHFRLRKESISISGRSQLLKLGVIFISINHIIYYHTAL